MPTNQSTDKAAPEQQKRAVSTVRDLMDNAIGHGENFALVAVGNLEGVLDRITALEEELKKWQSELAEAAREIYCAGPVSHRIRVLKREHDERVIKLEEELKAAQGFGSAATISLHKLGEDRDNAVESFRAKLAQALLAKRGQLNWSDTTLDAVVDLIEDFEITTFEAENNE